jgi:hypothetical protein
MEPEGKRSSRRLDIVTVRYAAWNPLAGAARCVLIITLDLGNDHD